MYETPFQNRNNEIERIINEDFVLLTICGESGIGKSRLLKQCRERWQQANKAIRIILVDMAQMKGIKNDPIKALLQEIIDQAPEMFQGVWNSSEQVAGLIVRQISAWAQGNSSLVLMFDTTEELKEDREFWAWMERYLVRPLVQQKKTKLIFAGRSPIRWQDFEIRRHAEKPLRLPPLKETAEDGPAYQMLMALFAQKKMDRFLETGNRFILVILNLSFGHPRLIEKLVDYLSEHQEAYVSGDDSVENKLSEDVVRNFIETQFLEGISPEWRSLIWWISVLEPFDTTLLRIYLSEVAPEKVRDMAEYHFLQGIRDLHENSILVWKEGQGEQFQGVVGKIIARCFGNTRRADFIKANQKAAEVVLKLSKEFLEDEVELRKTFEAQAEIYQQRVIEWTSPEAA